MPRLTAVLCRCLALTAIACTGFGTSDAALACTINPPGTPPTYGAFAAGSINNTAGLASCSPGTVSDPNTATGAYYIGTDNNQYTYANSTAVGSASGAIGTAAWGMVSSSADLATGSITVSASSDGNPPYSANTLTYGSPASAYAGYFVQLEFSGGEGETGAVSMGGLISYSGNVSANAALTLFQDTTPFFGSSGYGIVAGNTLPTTNGQAWSIPAQNFTIHDGVTYTLSVELSVMTSGSFLPGSVDMTDPISFDLPTGVTFTASDPLFLSAASTPVPEPASLALLGSALMSFGTVRRRVRKSARSSG